MILLEIRKVDIYFRRGSKGIRRNVKARVFIGGSTL